MKGRWIRSASTFIVGQDLDYVVMDCDFDVMNSDDGCWM